MPEIRLAIPGSIRSKKNSKSIIMVGGKNVPRRPLLVPSKAYETWEKQARASMWGKAIIPPLSCAVHVEAHFYYKGPQPDLSGCMESIADCLEGILWADDGFIYSWDGSRMHHDLDNPRTEIIVRY
jgi:Holliday junction resolvase RusA-like endonuclease